MDLDAECSEMELNTRHPLGRESSASRSFPGDNTLPMQSVLQDVVDSD